MGIFTSAWRLPVWASIMTWILFTGLLNGWQASAAVLGTTSRIPVSGFPDIVVTTFSLPGKSKAGPADNKIAAEFISITNQSCKNMCSGTAGSGPNQFDCTTISNSLAAASNVNITLSPFLGTEWAFRSCKLFVTNQDPNRSVIINQGSVAAVAEKLAAACNAANNAAGGLCLYQNISVAISVQHT